jgi:RNA polymerase sigma factor (sigma-70 family)
MDTTDERQRAHLMSERLVDLQRFLISVVMRRYGLTFDDAQDVYSETCVYMLDRGVKLINMSKDFDAAITSTMMRRASNHIRDHRRMNYDYVTTMLEREHLAAPDDLMNVEWEIDHAVIKAEMIKRCTSDLQRTLAEVYLDFDGLSINEHARRWGLNENSLHAAGRALKAILRDIVNER